MSEYVATTRSGWGRAYDEYGAIQNALANTADRELQDDDDSGVDLWVYEVDGFEDIWPGGVEAETVHTSTHFALHPHDAVKVSEQTGSLERWTEDAILNGTTVDDE